MRFPETESVAAAVEDAEGAAEVVDVGESEEDMMWN